MGKLFPGSYGSVCSLSLQGVERMCIDPKTMQPTGGKCCGESKMRLPGCRMCDDDGCCPEHCCDWDTCECECSSGRAKYCQPSLDDPEHAQLSVEEHVALEQSFYGRVEIEGKLEAASAEDASADESPQTMPPAGPPSKRPSPHLRQTDSPTDEEEEMVLPSTPNTIAAGSGLRGLRAL